MLTVPEEEKIFYEKRPKYYQLVQLNLKKINNKLGNIEMTDEQKKTWLWLAGYEQETVENILDVIKEKEGVSKKLKINIKEI